jgi:hypothetical protein
MSDLRFMFDQHVNARALAQLRAAGVDVVHVAEIGLSEAADPAIFASAIEQERIIGTRAGRSKPGSERDRLAPLSSRSLSDRHTAAYFDGFRAAVDPPERIQR